jgi:cytochrome c-type biogenesis protein CcmF
LTKNSVGKLEKAFTLRPFIQMNDRMGNAPEPDTRHFLHKDIYTFIKFVPMTSLEVAGKDEQGKDGYMQPRKFTISKGDTIATGQTILILDSISLAKEGDSLFNANEETVQLYVSAYGSSMKRYPLLTLMHIPRDGSAVHLTEARNDELGVRVTVWKIDPKTGKIDLYVAEKQSLQKDFIVLEASVFPAINVLWLGCLIMVFGTALAVWERMKRNKSAEAA